MTTRLRKWLGRSIEVRLTYGELLVIIALVTLVNIFWPGVPTWAFFILGAVVSFTERTIRSIRCRRRRAA